MHDVRLDTVFSTLVKVQIQFFYLIYTLFIKFIALCRLFVSDFSRGNLLAAAPERKQFFRTKEKVFDLLERVCNDSEKELTKKKQEGNQHRINSRFFNRIRSYTMKNQYYREAPGKRRLSKQYWGTEYKK